MSILDRKNETPIISPAKIAANKLVQLTQQTYKQMIMAFNQGSQIFWNNSMGVTPSEIAIELDVDAKEIFELHHKLGQLLETIKPDAISDGVNLIGNFTMNEDGTVTINNS